MTVADLVTAHQTALLTIRQRITAIVEAAWAAQAGRYDDAALTAFVATVVPVVIAAQRAAATVTDGYLARVISEMTGEPTRPVGVSASMTTGAALRNGVSPAEVYARAVVTTRVARSTGTPIPEALQRGAHRAVTAATTDVQLAQRAATDAVINASPRIVGYRRTLTGVSCGLCAMASTQRYHRGDLMPIHAHCDCGVIPIIGAADPGRLLNGNRIDQLNQQLAEWDTERLGPRPENNRTALSRLQYEVRTHGEVGPVLVRAGQHFTGPGDIAA